MKVVDETIINNALKRVGIDTSDRLLELGFQHAKKWFWVRHKGGYADFIHLHLSRNSHGAKLNYSISFRVHCGNRILNDDFEALALNGPNSDSHEDMERRYHLRFNAKSGSTYDRCISDIDKFIKEMGNP